ncbi:MAG TPA: Hsp20/alpha crystallin family protein [Thermoanaerobaculia bacterium]|nr:Hsp20/alpha crystallin family protein [Thermoanaerobaculia bacterium]
MTFLTRYNHRSFEPFFRFTFADEATQANWNPAVDVAEETDKILVKVEAPGMDEKDLKVSFEDGLLTVSGERQFERKDDRNYHRIERSYGSFVRQFTLPRSVDVTNIVANYRNGVLEIEIPKKEEARPRQIQVNVNASKTIEA